MVRTISAVLIIYWNIYNPSFGQSNSDILAIRENYNSIREQLGKLQKDTVDGYKKITEREFEESQSGGHHNFNIYLDQGDTLLIQEFSGSDEGGAFTLNVTEVYFKDSSPFFYHSKSFASWRGQMDEVRIYLKEGEIIKKLEKRVPLKWNEIPEDNLLLVKSDHIPNILSRPDEYDISLIKAVKRELKKID